MAQSEETAGRHGSADQTSAAHVGESAATRRQLRFDPPHPQRPMPYIVRILSDGWRRPE